MTGPIRGHQHRRCRQIFVAQPPAGLADTHRYERRGIAMVVIVSGLGLGAHQKIEAQLQSAGPTLITIRFQAISLQRVRRAPARRCERWRGWTGGGALSLGDGGTASDVNGSSPNVQAARHVIKMSHFHSPATLLGEAEECAWSPRCTTLPPWRPPWTSVRNFIVLRSVTYCCSRQRTNGRAGVARYYYSTAQQSHVLGFH